MLPLLAPVGMHRSQLISLLVVTLHLLGQTIYICRPKIYFPEEQTSQPHSWSGEWRIWMLLSWVVVCSPTAPAFHSLNTWASHLLLPPPGCSTTMSASSIDDLRTLHSIQPKLPRMISYDWNTSTLFTATLHFFHSQEIQVCSRKVHDKADRSPIL